MQGPGHLLFLYLRVPTCLHSHRSRKRPLRKFLRTLTTIRRQPRFRDAILRAMGSINHIFLKTQVLRIQVIKTQHNCYTMKIQMHLKFQVLSFQISPSCPKTSKNLNISLVQVWVWSRIPPILSSSVATCHRYSPSCAVFR